jgi:general secretion pathway protein E
MNMFVDATQLHADLSTLSSEESFLRAIPIAYARERGVVMLVGSEGPMLVMAEPEAQTIDMVRRRLRRSLPCVRATPEQVRTAIDRVYQQLEVDSARLLDRGEALASPLASGVRREDLLDSGDRAPVIQLVNSLLHEALRAQASDVHLQPTESALQVRLRIDGVLHD